MNDDRIEELLRDVWQPEEPEGMRGRVLSRACAEVARRRKLDFRWMLGWKPALAALGVLIVLAANIDDNRREARLAALAGGSGISSPAQKGDYLRMRREMNEMLACVPGDGRPTNRVQDGGRL